MRAMRATTSSMVSAVISTGGGSCGRPTGAAPGSSAFARARRERAKDSSITSMALSGSL
jgi:ribulose 1,5-bisphosphate carboxylase large subunit-like protein